jgi:hypothetical protein
VTRAALLAFAFASVTGGCTTSDTASCPGGAVGSFSFTATVVAAGVLAPGLDPDPALPDCSAGMVFEPSFEFSGELASDSAGTAGVLCRASGGTLFGTRFGTRWVVENGSDGAVLGGCDPTCAAHLRVIVSGDVVPDVVSPTGFQGALVEQFSVTGGMCGACVLPCAARHALSGTAVGP